MKPIVVLKSSSFLNFSGDIYPEAIAAIKSYLPYFHISIFVEPILKTPTFVEMGEWLRQKEDESKSLASFIFVQK